MSSAKNFIPPATGKLGVLLPGMGAVATTFMAGVEAVRRGIAQPTGSLTQLGHIRLGKRTDNRNPLISELVARARKEKDVILPSYTHRQRAQPEEHDEETAGSGKLRHHQEEAASQPHPPGHARIIRGFAYDRRFVCRSFS